jgi:hypothetical protein
VNELAFNCAIKDRRSASKSHSAADRPALSLKISKNDLNEHSIDLFRSRQDHLADLQ